MTVFIQPTFCVSRYFNFFFENTMSLLHLYLLMLIFSITSVPLKFQVEGSDCIGMTVFIQPMFDLQLRIPVKVSSCFTISQLKHKIQHETGFEVEKQMLFLANKPMVKRTLGDHDIREGSIITLMLRKAVHLQDDPFGVQIRLNIWHGRSVPLFGGFNFPLERVFPSTTISKLKCLILEVAEVKLKRRIGLFDLFKIPYYPIFDLTGSKKNHRMYNLRRDG